jgi:single-stranded-DNA-specific exonuclease
VDNDGITSGTYTFNYLNKLNNNLNITYSMNKGKAHGIKVENIPKETQLLIVPDAGSDDKESQDTLCNEYDMDILILDHHNYTKHDSPYCIIINNQDDKYPNKHLSGVGVCYKFFKEFDKKYGYNYADIDLDLVAIGMIGDNMDMSDYETRYLALKGLSQISNETVKEILVKKKILKDLNDKDSTVNITNVEWDISPCFNATIRSGTEDERKDMLRAMNGEQELREYKPRKSKTNPNPEIEQQTLQKTMARVFQNIRSRQNRSAEKSMKELLTIINDQQLDKNKIIVVDSSDVIEESTFTGLVANKLAEHFKRPALVLREKNKDTYGGSGRNYKLSSIENLNKDLMDTKCFESVEGHDNSFGISIKKDKIQEMISTFNEQHEDMIIEDVYLVDYEIPVGRLKPSDVLQVGQWKDIWGGGISEPLFAITNINLDTKDIKLVGEKKNFIIITKEVGGNTIKFTKSFSSEEEYKKMVFKNSTGLGKAVERVKMDIIGKFTINEYNGNEYPQIEIIDYNVSQGTRSRF